MADLVLKQFKALIDERTTMTCLRAAGQIQPVDQPYDTLNGLFQSPPCHVHCRSQSVPFMPGFVTDMRDAANAEVQRRPLKQRRWGGPDDPGPKPPPGPIAPPPPTTPEGMKAAFEKGHTVTQTLARGTSRSVERVTLSDGTDAVLKVRWTPPDVTAEVLASRMANVFGVVDAQAVDLSVMGLTSPSEYKVLIKYVPGRSVAEVTGARVDVLVKAQNGKETAMVDWLTDNRKRSSVNWIVREDGSIQSIEHGDFLHEVKFHGGKGNLVEVVEPKNPLVNYWMGVKTNEASEFLSLSPRYTLAELDGYEAALKSLQPEFAAADAGSSYVLALRRLQMVRDATPGYVKTVEAGGKKSLITKAKDKAKTALHVDTVGPDGSRTHWIAQFLVDQDPDHLLKGENKFDWQDRVSGNVKKLRKELNKTPLGAKTVKLVEKWAGHMDEIPKLRADMAAGKYDDVMDVIRNGANAPDLYRGMNASTAQDSLAFTKLKAGDEFDLRGLASFSSNNDYVSTFMEDMADEDSVFTSVNFTVHNAKGLQIGSISDTPFEQEWLLTGKLKLTNVKMVYQPEYSEMHEMYIEAEWMP